MPASGEDSETGGDGGGDDTTTPENGAEDAGSSDDAIDDGDDAEEADGSGESGCGNGRSDPGEDCDGDPARGCATDCGSAGMQACAECRWETGCAPPVDVCNGLDDDCDGRTDRFAFLSPPVRVSDADGWESSGPSVAVGAGEIAVAWSDQRDAPDGREIYFARFSIAGTRLGPARRLTYSGTHAFGASLVYAREQYGLAWRDYRYLRPDVFLGVLGHEEGPPGIEVRVTDEDERAGNMAWLVASDDGYALAWQSLAAGSVATIALARFSSGGDRLTPDVAVSDPDVVDARSPAAAAGGGGLGVVWRESPPLGCGPLRFGSVDRAGVRTAGPVTVAEDVCGPQPDVVDLGSDFGIVWGGDASVGSEDSYLTVARVAADGTIVMAPHYLLWLYPGHFAGVRAARLGELVVVAYTVEAYAAPGVYAFDPEGSTRMSGVPVEDRASMPGGAPALATDGVVGVVAWVRGEVSPRAFAPEVFIRTFGGCIP